MADRKESFSNGHFRLLFPWILRRFLLRRAGSKAQADCAPLRPTRSRPRIGKNYSKQARKRKLPCSGAMADLEECFSNGHLQHLLHWKSRRGFWRARSKALKVCTPIRQPEREDLSAARAKVPRKRGTQCKDSISLVKTPSLHTLIAQPGSGSGAAPPDGEASQGPSPVDYNLEIEADFPKELVLTMQENAAKKARRTVIGRTLGGRATFKTLLDCLKLHLPAPLVSTTLLTRGYFEILFKDKEGAKATRRLTAVEWSDLRLSFSRYIPNFDASSQGAEAQLTHAIKVQFPDLHEQFRNTKALTIMANKIGEVLEIEPAESYIKKPAGPLITIELKDISKLPGYIRIPSMAEGAETDDMIAQKILYSGLPNQCRNCRRFGHHAWTCTTSRNKPWEGVPSSTGPPSTSAPVRKQLDGGAPHPKQDQGSRLPRSQKVESTQAHNRMNPVH
ncbi:hypothetical protein CY35_13G019100 [Sphagnum magellanicum]|nr:hypothetical protein CY35_13G019100 [Sphagnum magellanicum]